MAADHTFSRLAQEVLARCDLVASFSEEPRKITRTFLCQALHQVHVHLAEWLSSAGMSVRIDAAGNMIGHYPGKDESAPVFLIGSHLDTVPNAGRYDGVLGVLLGVAAVEALSGKRLPFAIDVLGFSEEEGIRFKSPYLGSRAVCGCFDFALLQRTDASGVTMEQAFRDFGLNPAAIGEAAYPPGKVLGYLEAHIEQGPVLESRGLPLGIVRAIVGQSRLVIRFNGVAGHAGTLPMDFRRDALAAGAEFVLEVEKIARSAPDLRATVGSLTVAPGASNVVPGSVRLTVDVRHPENSSRDAAVRDVLERVSAICARRKMAFEVEHEEHHAAVPMESHLTDRLETSVRALGYEPLSMTSGAGHDAVVMAHIAPVAMLFLRSPGGISHHPDEAVLLEDVEAALKVMSNFLQSTPEGSETVAGG